ncbi:hypothetical protein [Spirosoma sp. KUDC1026]|uniref:hypothetical protein n=1 Tax=Spirosoma sp. KUDC1026 TaxID=2745947 RepID=UPI00159BA95C|nr:hypothetical protein [Spirosoma sp. KUDC1026]QKZ11746.1 hypothetical protein HU175_03530 [Spirosoma sp. KUDC1026]
MKKRLLFCAFAGSLASCQREGDIQPARVSVASEVVGTYETNAFTDVLHVATPANQMPTINVTAETDTTVTMTYTNPYPSLSEDQISHVLVRRQAEGVYFWTNDTLIGSLQNDRAFTSRGIEKQAEVLRINAVHSNKTVRFVGFK